MSTWLFDTLVWTAVLIALVLVLRRPVARHFGPQAAYALWLLPFLRLILPPIQLPAWLAPENPVEPVAASTVTVTTWTETTAVTPAAAEASGFAIDWAALLLAIWLAGAVVFIARRFQLYFQMRSELLADATPVGEAGKVRLVETPAATSPVAFGVIDKVVALPAGFMASFDRISRDLALEHELAHHRGHDLLANFAAQPLFALHWFNPLAWAGWRAMRRDQEAACDARVVARRAREERATYAEIIAGFAAGPNIALAAPMACPVLGEKSIIHRLRSLNMSDISPRRRLAGRALIAAGVLALPLTASITYAEGLNAPEAPLAPAAPTAMLAPPAPAAPAAPGAVPAPPAPPAPPMALALQAAAEAGEQEDERVVIVRKVVDEDGKADGDGKHKVKKKTIERKIVTSDGRKLTPEERAEIMAEVRESMKDLDVDLAEAREEMRVAMLELDSAKHGMTKVKVKCRGGDEGTELRDGDGKTVTRLCTSDVMANALAGLKEARAQIAKSQEMDTEIRAEVLSALDAKIAEWKDRR